MAAGLAKFLSKSEFEKITEELVTTGRTTFKVSIPNPRLSDAADAAGTILHWGDMMHNRQDKCVYCNGELEEVGGQRIWPARVDLTKKRFMICWNCSAWVGMSDEGIQQGYAAKQHIRELRHMCLTAWHAVCDTGAMPYKKADEFRAWLKNEHGFDTSDLGWMEEEELRTLLHILDKMVIPDTPEVDALFR